MNLSQATWVAIRRSKKNAAQWARKAEIPKTTLSGVLRTNRADGTTLAKLQAAGVKITPTVIASLANGG